MHNTDSIASQTKPSRASRRSRIAFGSVGAGAALGLAVAILGAAIPASAAGPHVAVSTWKAVDYSDSSVNATHYDRVGSSTYHFANLARPGQTSAQVVCWAGVTSYGYASSY